MVHSKIVQQKCELELNTNCMHSQKDDSERASTSITPHSEGNGRYDHTLSNLKGHKFSARSLQKNSSLFMLETLKL